MKFPWTRLEGSDLWASAAGSYRANGHAYHDLGGHIRRVYGHAERFGIPYDLSLDRAILAHDVILEGKGRDEELSAAWLDRRLERADPLALQLIMTTVDHKPSHPDARLALLDLADFIDPGQSRINSRLLRDEARLNRGQDFDEEAWVRGTTGYLMGLNGRIQEDLKTLEGDDLYRWTRVSHGIARTIAVLPLVYAPHPSQGIIRFTIAGETVLRAIVAAGRSSQGLVEALEADPDPVGLRVTQALVGLEERGMVRKVRNPEGRGMIHEPTDEGIEWVRRMNTPQEPFPEPEFP